MSEMPFTFSPGNFAAPGVDWLNKNFHPLFAGISATGGLNGRCGRCLTSCRPFPPGFT